MMLLSGFGYAAFESLAGTDHGVTPGTKPTPLMRVLRSVNAVADPIASPS
jgi:hypothetical protein